MSIKVNNVTYICYICGKTKTINYVPEEVENDRNMSWIVPENNCPKGWAVTITQIDGSTHYCEECKK